MKPPSLLRLAALFAALGLYCLWSIGCARPTAPTSRGPVRLALAGQSNAMLIQPFLAEHVVAFYGEVTTIAPCWSAAGSCWSTLRPSLSAPLDAFVWSQGEADALAGTTDYSAQLSALVARVRTAVGQPRLLVVVPQMGPMFDGPRMGVFGDALQRERRAWVAADINAVYVPTFADEYRADEVHMTDAGYTALAARIVSAVEARR